MEKLKPRAHSPLENHSSIGEAEKRTGERGGRRRSANSIMGQIIWQESKGKGQHRRKGKVWS